MANILNEVLQILRANQEAFHARGVMHAAIFGSVARGEARSDSDVDILVKIDPGKHIGVFGYVGIAQDMSDLLGRKVDLASCEALRPIARDEILREKIDAF